MRILVCHSRYQSGAVSGENRVADDEVRLLREAGHSVATYMPSAESKGKLALLKTGVGSVWSSKSVDAICSLAAKHRSEVIHFHNLFPMLSPASLRLPEATGRRILMTLHNYRLSCLPATLLRNGQVCEVCLGRIPWRGVVFRCYRGSAVASGVLALSLSLHRAIGTFDLVHRYLAISEFVKRKHVEAGIPEAKIIVKAHFAWETARRDGAGRYFLFLGRLSVEKGVETLLQAWPGASTKLLIAGDGPERPRLQAMAPAGVEFLGAVPASEAQRLIQGARCLVAPSIGYEGAGRAVLEAYAAGVPVIASDIGGLSESVRHDVSGLVCPASDVLALRNAIDSLLDDAESERLGEGAWRLWNERYRPELALSKLEAAYADDRSFNGSQQGPD